MGAQEGFSSAVAKNIEESTGTKAAAATSTAKAAAKEKAKEEQMKHLADAMSEMEKERIAAAKEAAKNRPEEPPEPLGFGGWVGLLVLGLLIVAGLFNFGRPQRKNTNPNRKRGCFEQLLNKLK